ncbi:AraC family transcriptional regulator [Mucilaginibacter sp. PAMB04274]|uniref:helix-turn-helix domain-containing protein n=1 Tax=Mucilaginibacter sp. PAMB04274 TaxID=3138568 RepID=UPI0031F6ACB3
MEIFQVPDVTINQPQITAGEVRFVDYKDMGGPFRNRVLFKQYAFSFVQNGQKQIYRAEGSTILKSGQGMLIPEGHSIIAEHSNSNEPYNSIIIFFPATLGKEFISSRQQKNNRKTNLVPYIHFNVDSYIDEYIRSLKALIMRGQKLSLELGSIKVHELLTALYDLHPELLTSLFNDQHNLSLMGIIEQNLFKELSIDELAFLANRSLSSFKRDFIKTYGLPPQQYIRNRKLEIAGNELLQGRLASELYLDYGYQHLSNFTTAFKKKFGVTPSHYRSSS